MNLRRPTISLPCTHEAQAASRSANPATLPHDSARRTDLPFKTVSPLLKADDGWSGAKLRGAAASKLPSCSRQVCGMLWTSLSSFTVPSRTDNETVRNRNLKIVAAAVLLRPPWYCFPSSWYKKMVVLENKFSIAMLYRTEF
eukprot:616151-Rhodomonas_salina.1